MINKLTALVDQLNLPGFQAAATFFILASFPLYGLMLYVPFSPLHPVHKFYLTAGLFIASELSFWGGAVLLGKDVMERYRQYFSPAYWFNLIRDKIV